MPTWLKWWWPGATCTLKRAKEHFKMTDTESVYIEKVCQEYAHPCEENGERVIYCVHKVWAIRWRLFIRRHIVIDEAS